EALHDARGERSERTERPDAAPREDVAPPEPAPASAKPAPEPAPADAAEAAAPAATAATSGNDLPPSGEPLPPAAGLTQLLAEVFGEGENIDAKLTDDSEPEDEGAEPAEGSGVITAAVIAPTLPVLPEN